MSMILSRLLLTLAFVSFHYGWWGSYTEEDLLRDTGVCTAPGVDFDPVHGNRFMRFSFAVSTQEVEEALRRMGPWFAARAA